MKNVFKLLVPAIFAIALFASCEDRMDEITVDEATVESSDGQTYLPRKDKIVLPPQ